MRYPGILLLTYLFCLLAAVAAPPAGAQDDETASHFFREGLPIEIEADYLSYDRDTETYHAKGDVVITQDSTTLSTDEVMLNTATGVGTARGRVRLVDEGGNTLEGEDLLLDLREKTAVVTHARIFYREQNIYITGSPIEKFGPESYRGEDMTFTTCDCEEGSEPAWEFTSSRAKVTVGEFMTARNVFFNIKGWPVFYTPYARVPVKRERQTGFLPPHPGYSELKGFKLDVTFFWAISDHQDATFYVDYEASRGEGLSLEYRYYRTRRSYGEAFVNYFREKDIDRVRDFRKDLDNLARPQTAGDNRWQFVWDHTEQLGRGMNFRARINVVSDDEYFIDFGEGTSERSLESLESNISFSKNWSGWSLVGQLRRFDNLLNETDDATLQRYPEVTLTATERRIGPTPLHASLDSSYINFVRNTGVTGSRLDLKPRVSLPMSPGGYFDFKPSVGPRATFYMLSNNPGDRYAERYLYDVKADLTTTFVRIFRPSFGGLEAVRHNVRPMVSYLYIPELVQDDLPSFDGVDRIAATNRITYSVNSLITGKRTDGTVPTYTDYLYLELEQSFDFREAGRDLASATDERQPFSDIRGEVVVRPLRQLTVRGKGMWDAYDNWFNSYDASIEWVNGRGDHANASYRYVRGTTNYFEANAYLRITRKIDARYTKRFSFDSDRALETAYGIIYNHQCWTAALNYIRKPEENLMLVTFDLLGLGRVAGVEATMQPF